ncbi:MAG TPA: A24 family peptidase [Candidatus Binatia bacterium]|nr:A24 family peptidase [Candidatus Binatia bacterium]
MPAPIAAAVVALVTLAVGTDVRARRIPNHVSGAAALAGLVLNALYFGAPGLRDSAAGLVVVVALLLPPFALGGVGGGDVKMMGAVGALLGPARAVAALGAGMALGGVVMAAHLAGCGRLREKLRRLGCMSADALLHRSLVPLGVAASAADAVALPYSVPLGLGTLAVLLLVHMEGGW